MATGTSTLPAPRQVERVEVADELHREELLPLAVGDHLNDVGQDDQARASADQRADRRVRLGVLELGHDRLAGDVGGDDVEDAVPSSRW